MDYPSVTVVVTTYLTKKIRRQVAIDTLTSWRMNLVYLGDLSLCVSDDGSTLNFNPEHYWKDVYTTRQERHGVGASLNAGFRKAFERSPLVLYAVDDWSLIERLDLTPWVQLLLEREDVGVVRLGPPHPGTKGTVEIFTSNWQGWGLRLDREGFAFGHRPALYHQRMIESYGWFKEDCSALECEQNYNERYCAGNGPDVILALPHPWQHLESIELSAMEPQ